MRWSDVLRWTARVWSLASILVICAFAFGGRESLQLTGREAFGFFLFPVGVVVGLGIAWWREELGGLVTLGSLALFYVWMFVRDGRLPGGPYFLLLAAPAFLFIAAALLSKRRNEAPVGPMTPDA